MDFSKPVGYLEYNDFSEGNLRLKEKNNTMFPGIFVLIQGSYCGACNKAKPEFQKLANEGVVTCMTIQLDGEKQSEKDIGKILDDIYPNMKGVPSYIYFKDASSKLFYEGDRTFQDMKKFIQHHNVI